MPASRIALIAASMLLSGAAFAQQATDAVPADVKPMVKRGHEHARTHKLM